MIRLVAPLALVLTAPAAHAFDANGVVLGGSEADVKKAFPSAYCKPLEWKTGVADRRCDDGRIDFGGVRARITFYLKGDALQAFQVRFESSDRDRVAAHARARWGAPSAEATETIRRRDRDDRRIYRVRWERHGERAVLTAPLDRKRATLEAWRGNFADEIYRVR